MSALASTGVQMAHLVIRQYSPEASIVDAVRLLNHCYADSPGFSPLTMEELERLRTDGRLRPELFLTAYLDGEPVGLCMAFLRQGDTRGWLDRLGVLPGYRRRGVARALLKQCVENLRDAGAQELLARSVELGDLKARSLLESEGFKEAYRQLLMVRDLASPLPDYVLPQPYRVRTLKPREGEAWLRVRNEAFRNELIASRPWTLEDFRREFVDSPYAGRGRIFAVEHLGEVVGVAAAWYMHYRGVEREIVHWLGVLAPHRRRGVGQALVLEALRFFQERGSKEARLITQSALPNAVRLYRKLGFTVERESVIYSRPVT
ncbi:MAG: GNAT family N-acetyltransferase [Candidatus Bathyarchaeia archaeon]